MHKFFISFLCLYAFFWVSEKEVKAEEEAIIFTSFIPPVVLDNPDKPGLAYEIIAELFAITGKKFKVNYLPWARAQHMAQNTPRALIFPLSKTPTREPHYLWRVNIFNNQTHFITFNGEKLSAETAKTKRIGVQLKSSWDNWLTEKGYENVYRIPKAGAELIKLLQNNRLDAWYTDLMISSSILKNINDERITFSNPIQIFKTYLATNKEQPYPHIDKLKAAMKTLRESGKLTALFKKYGVHQSF